MRFLNTKTKYARMQQFLTNLEQPKYRFKQITDAIFKQRIHKFEQMTALPKTIRDELKKEFGENLLSIEPVFEQSSQQVRKFLFKISGNNQVEAVGMKYRAGWESFCISSQCGCGLGCQFCATGSIGLKRNLTADEITDQLLYFYLHGHSLDSIAFMGMGEALANPQIFDALTILTDPDLFGLSPRRITVSTVGIIPNIKKMTTDFPQVNLTFSLHSPFNDQRSSLMPINNKFPLDEVMKTLDEHIRITGRKVYIAYIMLRGVNDSIKHAKGVAKLLQNRGKLYHVNLIRYNPTVDAPEHYKETDEKKVQMFYKELHLAGIHVTIRSQFGIDIDAACGQLYGQYQTKTSNPKVLQDF
ncbi:Cfr family 23S rRNA (adenine(2503)-C(8))-methyltransferase [Bacillus paramycoides]|uniref:Cfr family 23S rRNA (adenine(2503)-C(8))-methyltransferase n=1 Tax=Bacillus paramycoides TaxID=2026194 RepID=UPI00224436B7|nr:Cfr family 23S rRNA (adenine(2503)-C(8))-methyltransferase [Bacillus paramycoides]MCW9132501.1 Cfr family 23S rRNA (adenine(2503)-C(8))-methyltransferase [Bacillus paramycoides]